MGAKNLMGEGYNFKNLKEGILSRSHAPEWNAARFEWVLIDIFEADEPEACLCGHYPILEICIIRNRITNNIAEVGNVCVKRFFGIRSDLIFAGLERVRMDIEKSLNESCIEFFFEKNLVSPWERNFLYDTKSKRILTARQLDKRKQINKKVMATVSRRGLQVLQ